MTEPFVATGSFTPPPKTLQDHLEIMVGDGKEPLIVPLPGYVSVEDLRSGKAKIVVYGGGGGGVTPTDGDE